MFEPAKNSKAPDCSEALILLGRDGEIRTHEPLHPMQVRYRAALHPDLMFDLAETESPGGNAHGNGSPFKGLQRYEIYYFIANPSGNPRNHRLKCTHSELLKKIRLTTPFHW